MTSRIIVNNIQSDTGVSTVTFSSNISAPRIDATRIVGVSTIGVTTAYIGAINDGAISGARNRIINGDMRIDQRNSGASVTPTDASFGPDRWKFRLSQASKYTAQRTGASVPVGFTSSLLITSSSAFSPASGDYFNVQQPIEGFNVSDLNWGSSSAIPVTVSFWVRSSLNGTFAARLLNAAANRSYVFTYTINSTNTWEYKNVTIPGDTTGIWVNDNGIGLNISFDLGTGSSFETSTPNTWLAGDFIRTSSSVRIIGTNGATWYLTGVQLEAGTVATPFERRSYGQELALCQRYLPTYRNSSGNEYITWGNAVNSTQAVHGFSFQVPTRVPPTGITISSASHFYSLNGGVSTAPGTASVVSFEGATSISGSIRTTVASGLTAGQFSYLWTNNTSAYIFFTGCEL